MQCNGWSTAARLLRTINRPNFPISKGYWNDQQWPLHASKVFHSSLTSRPKTNSVASTARMITRRPPPTSVVDKPAAPLDPGSFSSLPPAKVSRAASQTIRICLSDKHFVDALYVLNSMRFSVELSTPPSQSEVYNNSNSTPSPRSHTKTPKFINFGQPLPLRLASHSLLHGFLRAGQSKEAARQAQLFMMDGIRVRTKTVEAILAAVVSDASSVFTSLPKVPLGPHVMQLRTHKAFIANSTTRIALDLLEQAKRRRQERTERMYDIVINACLLQGEIIVASLLFVILVKDWELQKAAKARREAAAVAQAVQAESSTDFSDAPLPVYPKGRYIRSILDYIQKSTSEQAAEDVDSPSFVSSLQALSIVARLFDEKLFYTRNFSYLIKILYSVPKSDAQVWSGPDHSRYKVNAFTHFHAVLGRLIWMICGKRKHDLDWYRNTYPHREDFDFDMRTYNSLLHYALRNRMSTEMANGLLRRIMEQKSLQPDIATYNILLRSGTLLRRSDLSETVLTTLRQNAINSTGDLANMIAFGGESSSYSQATWEHLNLDGSSKFSKILRQLRNAEIMVPPTSQILVQTGTSPASTSHNFAGLVQVDKYTLSSFIAHLTSTNRAHVVVQLLWYLLPEIRTIDYPDDQDESLQQNLRQSQNWSRKECIERVVTYGPYFFTVVLNALTKAGKTGLAERVWILAKEAERASWIEGFAKGVKPWCLPVHAYTCMLQCYAAEGKKGLDMRETHSQWMLKNEEWVPKSNNHVRGWAKFVYLGTKVVKSNSKRADMARIMGTLLYRSMISGAQAVVDAMKAFQDVECDKPLRREVSIPTPDERYYNAALNLFGRQMGMHKRAVKSRKSHWRWLLTNARTRYEKTGVRSVFWQPILQEIVQEMDNRGYPVPWGYRFMLVGRSDYKMKGAGRRRKLLARPWAYPDVPTTRFSPHVIPTIKTRGLPVGRRHRDWRRLRTTRT